MCFKQCTCSIGPINKGTNTQKNTYIQFCTWFCMHLLDTVTINKLCMLWKPRRKMSSNNSMFVETCKVLYDRLSIIIQFPATSDQIIHATMTMLCGMLTVTAICLNTCSAITIWKTPALKEKLSNFVIMMQSITDILHGTLVMPLFTYLMVSEMIGTGCCTLTYVCEKLETLHLLYSIAAFSMVNHERYMGICHPIIHRTRISKRQLMKYLIGVWTVETLAKGLAIFYGNITRFVLGVVSLAFLAHTIFVYARIGHAIQNKFRANKKQRGAEERNKLMQYLSEIKAAKVCFLIVICCIICNLPAIITFSGMISIGSIFTNTILRRYFVVLVSLNSSLNSVILFWKNKRLRIHVRRSFTCSCK